MRLPSPMVVNCWFIITRVTTLLPGKGPRYLLNLARSNDGAHWQPVLTLEDKPLQEGYGCPAIIQASDGWVQMAYTVGRERIKLVVVDPAKLSTARVNP